MTLRKAFRAVAVALALCAGLAGCAGQRPAPVVAPSIAKPTGDAVARTALSVRGAPYRSGGTLPDGFDCSGLVVYVFARHGWEVPRVVERQAAVGGKVSRAAVRPGDLVFFTTTGPGPTHVAIALDRNRFIHAPKQGTTVRIESLQSSYWATRFLYARRLTR